MILVFLEIVNKMTIKGILVLLLILALVTFGLVKGVNFLTLEYMNSNSEYKQTYESKFEKGYLTEKDVEELKVLEEVYINDSKARAEQQNKFYGTLLIGMSVFLLLSFLLSKALVLKGFMVIITLTVLVTSFLASTLWQSLFWCIFFYAGIWLGQMGKN